MFGGANLTSTNVLTGEISGLSETIYCWKFKSISLKIRKYEQEWLLHHLLGFLRYFLNSWEITCGNCELDHYNRAIKKSSHGQSSGTCNIVQATYSADFPTIILSALAGRLWLALRFAEQRHTGLWSNGALPWNMILYTVSWQNTPSKDEQAVGLQILGILAKNCGQSSMG